MAIFDLYSKRQKELCGEIPDIYTYDKIPKELRVQIIHIVKDALGEDGYSSNKASEAYKFIHDTLCREYGKFILIDKKGTNAEWQVLNFILQEKTTAKFIDIVEITFRFIEKVIMYENEYSGRENVKISPNDAIKELNGRFKEHGIGYSYEKGRIFRVDSRYTHEEITKNTISLLWNDLFKGANEEFLKAHEHYRDGRNKECLVDCLKAFESTMKVICSEKGWQFKDSDTAKKLINICLTNELIPSYMQTQIHALQNLLESGVPVLRNRGGGHGQGQKPKKVDDSIAKYTLNLVGSNIIFMIEQSGI